MKEVPPIGARVVRNRPYNEVGRVLTGEVIGSYGMPPTHARVRYDDGMIANVHPTALDLLAPGEETLEKLPTPPRFATVEEADDWLEEQAQAADCPCPACERKRCPHSEVVSTFGATSGQCLACGATISGLPEYQHFG